MVEFFVTIWLKAEDSKKDQTKIIEYAREKAEEMSIILNDEASVSRGGKRITFRGRIDNKNVEKHLESFCIALEKSIDRTVKGRILK